MQSRLRQRRQNRQGRPMQLQQGRQGRKLRRMPSKRRPGNHRKLASSRWDFANCFPEVLSGNCYVQSWVFGAEGVCLQSQIWPALKSLHRAVSSAKSFCFTALSHSITCSMTCTSSPAWPASIGADCPGIGSQGGHSIQALLQGFRWSKAGVLSASVLGITCVRMSICMDTWNKLLFM